MVALRNYEQLQFDHSMVTDLARLLPNCKWFGLSFLTGLFKAPLHWLETPTLDSTKIIKHLSYL